MNLYKAIEIGMDYINHDLIVNEQDFKEAIRMGIHALHFSQTSVITLFHHFDVPPSFDQSKDVLRLKSRRPAPSLRGKPP